MAIDLKGHFIASTHDSFSNKQAIMYWAEHEAERNHKTLGSVRVYCSADDSYSEYSKSGRLMA